MKAPGVIVLVLALTCVVSPRVSAQYDLVLAGGRVLDPETGLDAIRNVGISDGSIARIAEHRLQGSRVIDVSGLVVSPGFIDIHAHGQSIEAAELQMRDGVTTALELEVGVYPVRDWYNARKGSALINYGASVGHLPARIHTVTGLGSVLQLEPDPDKKRIVFAAKERWESAFEKQQIEAVCDRIAAGLDDGALGVGIAPMYYIGASREEVYKVMALAGERGQLASIHARYFSAAPPDSVEGVQEMLANAAATGVKLHFNHVHSIFGTQAPIIFEMLEKASRNGLDISTEALMFTRAGVGLDMVLFDDPDWQSRYGFTYSDMMLASTGETLTKETFQKYLEQTRSGKIRGWMYVRNYYPDWVHELSVKHPMSIIASDSGTPGQHPRTAGTFGKLLGHFVREKQWLTLMEAISKITLQPAKRLETFAPVFKRKGRLQEGADADITIFDPAEVMNGATYTDQTAPTIGIPYVLVNGVLVVDDFSIVPDVYPGEGLRTTTE